MTKDEKKAIKAIYTAVRGDYKSQCWNIRKWLDDHDIFNDDLGSTERLVEQVCLKLLKIKP